MTAAVSCCCQSNSDYISVFQYEVSSDFHSNGFKASNQPALLQLLSCVTLFGSNFVGDDVCISVSREPSRLESECETVCVLHIHRRNPNWISLHVAAYFPLLLSMWGLASSRNNYFTWENKSHSVCQRNCSAPPAPPLPLHQQQSCRWRDVTLITILAKSAFFRRY